MSKKTTNAPPDPDQVTEALNNSILREMVNNLEETKLKLLLNIKELKDKLAQQKDDQADIYYYLNKKCDESFEVIASLEEQIINEQTDREIAEKLYENKIDELKTFNQISESKHTSKISELETKLEMLNSFNEEKEESERNLKLLMTKLEEERIQFRANAENIENRFLVERDKLRKTYDIKYEKIKKELEISVEGKMSNKTKKTQVMNIIMKKELDNQSQHAEKLLDINQNILDRDKSLKLELDLANSLNSDMVLRLAMSQRQIKQLSDKISRLESAENDKQQTQIQQLNEKVETVIQLEAKLNNLTRKTTAENNKMDDMWHFLSRAYQMIIMSSNNNNHQPEDNNSIGSYGTLQSSSNSLINGGGGSSSHEQILVSLVREVVRKYPKLISEDLRSLSRLGTSGSRNSRTNSTYSRQQQQYRDDLSIATPMSYQRNSSSGVSSRNQHSRRKHSRSHSSSTQGIVGAGKQQQHCISESSSQWIGVANQEEEEGAEENDDNNSCSNNSTTSGGIVITGIPAWDSHNNNNYNNRKQDSSANNKTKNSRIIAGGSNRSTFLAAPSFGNILVSGGNGISSSSKYLRSTHSSTVVTTTMRSIAVQTSLSLFGGGISDNNSSGVDNTMFGSHSTSLWSKSLLPTMVRKEETAVRRSGAEDNNNCYSSTAGSNDDDIRGAGSEDDNNDNDCSSSGEGGGRRREAEEGLDGDTSSIGLDSSISTSNYTASSSLWGDDVIFNNINRKAVGSITEDGSSNSVVMKYDAIASVVPHHQHLDYNRQHNNSQAEDDAFSYSSSSIGGTVVLHGDINNATTEGRNTLFSNKNNKSNNKSVTTMNSYNLKGKILNKHKKSALSPAPNKGLSAGLGLSLDTASDINNSFNTNIKSDSNNNSISMSPQHTLNVGSNNNVVLVPSRQQILQQEASNLLHNNHNNQQQLSSADVLSSPQSNHKVPFPPATNNNNGNNNNNFNYALNMSYNKRNTSRGGGNIGRGRAGNISSPSTTTNPATVMTVAGLGFVSPLVLPKL